MKTKLFTAMCIVALLTASVACGNQRRTDVTMDTPQCSPYERQQYDSLVLEARMGNAEACLALADYYRNGRVVERSLLNRLSMHIIYCSRMEMEFEDFLRHSYRADDPYRVLLEMLSVNNYNGADTAQLAIVEEHFPAEAKMLDVAYRKIAENDTVSFLQTLHEMEREGSELVIMMQLVWTIEVGDTTAYDAVLLRSADRFPIFNCLIGERYVERYHITHDIADIERAIEYYYKADAHAMLEAFFADGLYRTYEYFMGKGLLTCESKEMERLKRLAGYN